MTSNSSSTPRAFSTKRTEAKGAWRNTYSEIRCLDRYPTDSVVFGRNARSASTTTLDRKYPQLTGSVFFGPSRPPGATSVALPDNGIVTSHSQSQCCFASSRGVSTLVCICLCARTDSISHRSERTDVCVAVKLFICLWQLTSSRPVLWSKCSCRLGCMFLRLCSGRWNHCTYRKRLSRSW